MFRFVVMYVILFYHSSTIYAVINGVIFQVRFTVTSKEYVDHFVHFSEPRHPSHQLTHAYYAH